MRQTRTNKTSAQQRSGAVSVLVCILLVPLLCLLAFSIDYGFLLHRETDLQRTADQAALAGARDLLPDADGFQDRARVKKTVRQFVKMNLGKDFDIADSDIEIGRYKPETIYSAVELLNDGTPDTVRVKLRNDDSSNGSITLFFARMFGEENASIRVSATASLQKAAIIKPGAGVFPFAIEEKAWDEIAHDDTMIIYGDGKLEDQDGKTIPGNWGTVDIGAENNSTNALNDQIANGLSQDDLDALYSAGTIDNNQYIDASKSLSLNADTGLSAGLKHGLVQALGETKIAPIYRSVGGSSSSSGNGNGKGKGKGGGGAGGNNAYFEIVGWTSIRLEDFHLAGNGSYVRVRKSYHYDGNLSASNDLSDTSSIIEGAFTSPTLME